MKWCGVLVSVLALTFYYGFCSYSCQCGKFDQIYLQIPGPGRSKWSHIGPRHPSLFRACRVVFSSFWHLPWRLLPPLWMGPPLRLSTRGPGLKGPSALWVRQRRPPPPGSGRSDSESDPLLLRRIPGSSLISMYLGPSSVAEAASAVGVTESPPHSVTVHGPLT